ncbi:hypothetical protein LPW11_08410 [Geomonas sp. RF6]|uniref:hypothetical protein n=1 Tax=Geomonas sp. RF6 TaxID=2897342 RepID=UPI001E495F93|nr:hypothetical protein [Geomonas sp. RF6]UFS72202.1 hypothetical protein LPW11_08410 [Geomonas sp. RF6]
MRRIWQRLLLIMIILSCGIIFSLGSSARDTAPDTPDKAAQSRGSRAGNDAAASPDSKKVVVYYAQDRHTPW